MAKNHPSSHAARKGISGSPHTKGMPAGYLAGHTEDHLNAHNTDVGHLSRTHERLQEVRGGTSTSETPSEPPEEM